LSSQFDFVSAARAAKDKLPTHTSETASIFFIFGIISLVEDWRRIVLILPRFYLGILSGGRGRRATAILVYPPHKLLTEAAFVGSRATTGCSFLNTAVVAVAA
jgi:hypothetical protein